MAVNFLYKSEKAAEEKKKRKAQIKTATTVVLVIIVVVVAAMLGAGVYIRRESSRMAELENELQAEIIRLAQTEARVWQIDDRARVVIAEAKEGQKMGIEMRQVTPADDALIVGWGAGGGKGHLEVESVYPETLESYAKQLRTKYPKSAVVDVVWSSSGRWRMGIDLGGGI